MLQNCITLTFLALTTFVARSESCEPCYKTVCHGDTSKCTDGVVKDMCGCCNVCAKSEGETCGGLFHNQGRCGKGLNCVKRRPHSVKILGENDLISGVCEKERCGKKACGFNQRCVLNARGRPRCMCPRFCKNKYMPVCGLKNGQHYWNRCYLRKDECKKQMRIGFVNGPCKRCHENGVSYKFGDTITRKDKCQKCVCRHGKWDCEHDVTCQGQPEFPEFCDVRKNNCPEGFFCQGGKYEPAIAVVDIGIGFCIPEDEERQDKEGHSGDSECPKLTCEYCRHGYKEDAQGCSTCKCNKGKATKRMRGRRVHHKHKTTRNF